MGRIQGLFEKNNLTASELVKTGKGELHSVTVSWRGATVGDIVCQFIDDTADNGNAGAILVTVIAATANGNFNKEWPQGKAFSTGLFYKEGVVTDVFSELTAK